MTTEITALEIETLIHHSCKPINNRFYLRTSEPMSWEYFIGLMGDNPTIKSWGKCKHCIRTWKELSTLADENGDSVLFRDNISVYPEWSHTAIEIFKAKFVTSQYVTNIVYYPRVTAYNDLPNFGKEWSNGHQHLYFESNLPILDRLKINNISFNNKIISKCLTLLEDHTRVWAQVPSFKNYFSQASAANYGPYKTDIVRFCENMMNKSVLKKLHLRSPLLRPTLLVEIAELLAVQEAKGFSGHALMRIMLNTIKTFTSRANVTSNVRLTILNNFILNTDCDCDCEKFTWPKLSSNKERIAAIVLKNALASKDCDICNLLMGVEDIDNKYSAEFKVGLAIKSYLKYDKINLGNNDRRLYCLFKILTGEQQPYDLKDIEEVMFYNLQVPSEEPVKTFKSKSLESLFTPIVCGYFNCYDADNMKMLHKCLMKFTSWSFEEFDQGKWYPAENQICEPPHAQNS